MCSVLHTVLGTVLALGVLTCTSSSSAQRREPSPAKGTPPASAKDAPAKKDAALPGATNNLLAVDDAIPADPDIAQRLVGPRLAVEKEMHEVMGHAARPLTRRRPDGPDGLLGNLVADVMRAAAAEVTSRPVDVAFTNKGGLRGDLPRGPITRGDILEVMPFDNALVVVELTGADLQETLDRSAQHDGDPWSGVVFRIADKKALDVVVGGKPLDPAGTYRLCTNDYIVDGGGRYEALKRAKNVNRTGVLIRDAIIAHVQRATEGGRELDSEVGGRILGIGAPAEKGP